MRQDNRYQQIANRNSNIVIPVKTGIQSFNFERSEPAVKLFATIYLLPSNLGAK